MLFNKPMVLHSKQADGRHWLTTIDMPPLQIWPVAENHCRVGHFLATLISAKLGSLKSDIPEVAMKGPEGSEDESEQDDDPPQFITPQPPLDWTGDYDKWIVSIW